MSTQSLPIPAQPRSFKIIAALAIVFGAMTLFSAGSVLFGPQVAQTSAGAYLPFVVWFNFIAGFFYIVAGLGILRGSSWTLGLSLVLALATAVTAAFFAREVFSGEAYEMRTVGALGLRTGFWLMISVFLFRCKK